MENIVTTFSNIRNVDYNYIITNAVECSYPSLDLLSRNQHNTISLFRNKPTEICYEVPKIADVLVGFVAHKNVEIEIFTNKIVIARYNIWKGNFVYAIEDNYILPIICTRFHVIRINIIKGSIEDVSLIFGLIDSSDMRRFIAMNKFKTGNIYFGSGMCSDKPYETYNIFPNMRDETTLHEYMHMAKERTILMLEDMSKKTWNPSRIRMWCLPFDDNFAITEDKYKPTTRLWLDDVLMIDNFHFNYYLSNEEQILTCNIHELLSQQHMRLCGQIRYITYQNGEGMHLHKDHALEGGTHTFIIYLNNNTCGHICFENNNIKIIPRCNRCLIFDVEKPHWVEPCNEIKKIITGECAFIYDDMV